MSQRPNTSGNGTGRGGSSNSGRSTSRREGEGVGGGGSAPSGASEMVAAVPAMSLDGLPSIHHPDESEVSGETDIIANAESTPGRYVDPSEEAALIVVDSDSLPDISYHALYEQNQSHFQTRLQFERLQTKRQILLLQSNRNKIRLEKKRRDAARLLRQSPLSGPAIVNTPFRASVGGRPATMPGRGPSLVPAVQPDHLNSTLQNSRRAKVLANVHKSLAHGVLILAAQQLESVPRSIFNTFAVQTGIIRSVNLSKNNLRSIPKELRYFCNTTHLNLSYNKLEQLPDEIGDLVSLRVLRLQTNSLWSLPRTLFNCGRLEILDVSNNALADLPGNMAQNMTALKELYLQSNRLVQVPGSFAKLRSLERLDLNDNELMTLALCPVVQNIWDDEEALDEGVIGSRDWMKFTHPDTGIVSYFNVKTRESRRSKPAGFLDEDDSRWQKMMDATTRETYWFNIDTHETSWETPAEILEQFKRDMKVGIKDNSKSLEKKAEEEQLRMLARIEGSVWEAARESDGVKDYFTNVLTQETTWEMPADVDLWDGLKQLQVLRIARNRLAAIPESLTRAPVLEDLDFSENLVTALPKGFSSMPALRKVNFSDNQVKYFPKSINKLAGTLESLKANNNQLQRLHPSMGELKKLRVLWVENNQIPTVPISFRNLEGLVELNLESNPITVPTREVLLKGVDQIRWDCRRRFLEAKRGLPPKVGVKRYGVNDEVVALDKRFEADQKKILDVAANGIAKINPWTEKAEAKGFMAAKRGDLNLHWRNMEKIPDEVWEMTHLENLRVVGSPLASLPDLAFSSLANLTVLQLRQTGLTELPFSINSLPKLRECGLEDNKLAALPDEFGSGLKELVDLRLTNNQLTFLPEGFGEGLVKLRSLALDINFLEALPESLGKASALQFLTVTQNCLSTLPDRLADLHQLERLFCNQNRFEEIPPMVAKLRSLKSFRAGQNKIGPFLPEEFCESPNLQRSLEQLWLYNNHIKELPPNFHKLTFLTDVKVDMNPMRSPPPEIVNEGMQAMVRYMHARAHRVRMVLDKLDIFNFDFIQSHGRVGIGYVENHLTPTVENFLILDGEMALLQPTDVKKVEHAIDNFVNFTFYRNQETLGSMLKTLRKVLKERKAERRSQCLLSFVELLAYCDKHMVLEEHSFNSDIVLTWGADGLERKFYGLDVSALYREHDQHIDNMLFIENDVPVLEFDYTYADVMDALKNFKGPFGNVGSAKWVVPFPKCCCHIDQQLQLAKHLKKERELRAAEAQLADATAAGAEDDVLENIKANLAHLRDDPADAVSAAIKTIKEQYDALVTEAKFEAEAEGTEFVGAEPGLLRDMVAELNDKLAENGHHWNRAILRVGGHDDSTSDLTRASTETMQHGLRQAGLLGDDSDEEDSDDRESGEGSAGGDSSYGDEDEDEDEDDDEDDNLYRFHGKPPDEATNSEADEEEASQSQVSSVGVNYDFPDGQVPKNGVGKETNEGEAGPGRRRGKGEHGQGAKSNGRRRRRRVGGGGGGGRRTNAEGRRGSTPLTGISAQVTSKRELREMAIAAQEQEREDLIASLPLELQELPHPDGKCRRLAAICPQIVYTREEALRKAREDDEIRLYCDIMVSKVKAWLASAQAKVRLNLSVKFNKRRARVRIKELRSTIASLKKTAKQIKKEKESILLRKKMLEMGEEQEVHKFESMEEAMMAIEVITDEEAKCAEQIKDAEAEIRKNNEQKKKTNAQLEVQILTRVMEKYRSREEARLIEEFRWHAVENDLRRPWDGPDGQKFLEWRLLTVTKDPDEEDEEKEAQLKAMRKGEFVLDSDNEDEDIGKQMVRAVGY